MAVSRQGGQPFDLAQDHELVEWLVEWCVERAEG